MPRKQDAMGTLYADFQGQRSGALAAMADETRLKLQATSRVDMAGAPLNTLFVPQTYQQRVQRVWSAYGTDPLFHRLVNRFCEFAANGSQWEVPAQSNETSWIKRLKKWSGADTRSDREEDVWNVWSEIINRGIPGVIPGLNEFVRWGVKHMLLSSMFVPHWQIGEVKVGKQTYLMPTKMTCYPASSITLRRQQGLFVQEDMFLFRAVTDQFTPMQEGQFSEAPSFTALVSNPANMIQLPPINPRAVTGETESFALKYNWSPGDLVSVRRGATEMMGHGIYPFPSFSSLLPQFAIRQKLFAADAAILDGIINFIMMYKIGDKDHPPKPPTRTAGGVITTDGTIEMVRKLIQEGRTGPAMELFVPYYVDLVIKMPETGSLVSDTKYGPSATEILQAFGIFFSRTAAGARIKLDDINTAGFEQFIEAIRLQIKAFLQMMAAHIVEINGGKLKVPAQWSPNPLNTKSDAFIQELQKMKDKGMISAKTLFRHLGIDDDVEIRRIVQELAVDADDVFNENVPLTYVQQAIQPDEGGQDPSAPAPGGAPPPKGGTPKPATGPTGRTRKTTAIPPTKQRGRPKGSGKG